MTEYITKIVLFKVEEVEAAEVNKDGSTNFEAPIVKLKKLTQMADGPRIFQGANPIDFANVNWVKINSEFVGFKQGDILNGDFDGISEPFKVTP